MPEYKDLPQGSSETPSQQPARWHQDADSSLRLVWSLIRNRDFHQLNQRTGLPARRVTGSGPRPALPVTIELDPQERLIQIDALLQSEFAVPGGYAAEIRRNREMNFVTGRIPLADEIYDGTTAELDRDIEALLRIGKRAHAGVPAQPSYFGPSLGDVGLPADRRYRNRVLTGQGVVVGIIDDGCALARWNFIRRNGRLSSRIQYLWDQAGAGARPGWNQPRDAAGNVDFPGLELTGAAIDGVLNSAGNVVGGVIQEDRVYQALQYRPGSVATHGTHVMDIAAGNGRSLLGPEGAACDADIIFVQLPPAAVESGAVALEQSVIDGATYIFRRAEMLGRPAVVNVSYGGYDGPHDGTSALERAFDALLSVPNRAIVVSAGNGFEERCHASATVQRNAGWFMRWILPAVDPTPNDLEIWYPGNTTLEVRVQSPGPAITPSGWIPLNYPLTPIRRADNNMIVGYIEHLTSSTPNGDKMVFISLRPTDGASAVPGSAPAPSGTWLVELRNPGNRDALFHAWVRRDDSGRAASAHRRQSRFHWGDASPGHTVTGWACGTSTVSVGAFNTSTREVSGYSACGPTRQGNRRPARPKPDVYAPAEETARGGGVLSASSLSGLPTRMNGTSASAPHVTGLIALMFEYAASARRQGGGGLTAAQIRDAIFRRADRGVLIQELHQIADARVVIKQRDVWPDLVASGRMNFLQAMRLLFP